LQKLGGWTAIGLVCVSITSAALLSRIGPQIGPADFAAISIDPVKMGAAYAALPGALLHFSLLVFCAAYVLFLLL